MRYSGQERSVRRIVETLEGLVRGIAIDEKINKTELTGLRSWLETNGHMSGYPFDQLRNVIDLVLADGKIDAEEHEELLAWCESYARDDGLAWRSMDHATRKLHGVLQGIASDRRVTEKETAALGRWIRGFPELREHYPFNTVWNTLERVLADGQIDAKEHRELLSMCENFLEIEATGAKIHDVPDPEKEPWMVTDAPHLRTLEGICDPVEIEFDGRLFCFTGKAEFGPRRKLEALVTERGGIAKGKVSQNLHYLVIGALSNPVWVYATYGRKIEAVLENRYHRGAGTNIVHEKQFVRALG